MGFGSAVPNFGIYDCAKGDKCIDFKGNSDSAHATARRDKFGQGGHQGVRPFAAFRVPA